jgi:TolA-binding protein
VSGRFERARKELAGIVREFPEERTYADQAQWDTATSFLTQARVVDAFSPTLARGQYVRAAKELLRIATEHADHPQIGNVPQTLWTISQELEGRGYFEDAIVVWNDLTIRYPMEDLAQQAALRIAQTYHQKLQRPLKAAEAYQELNFVRGGGDQELQNAIFQIGSELRDQKRWVEALHVLEVFVDSFPGHPQAGQALTMVGQIHQTNEAWEDAIAAYRRVIDEFENGQWVKDAKWSIAECTINLSQWHEASEAYRKFVEAYGDDKEKVAEANRRIEVLKDLARYQGLVDEKDQRKAFDAQFQIASIVASQLSNRVKAIIEYRKVVANWPESHLADDALYEVGSTYLALGETQKAREALLEVAQKYPASPLADDALFLVGKSFEDEADKLATVTRAESIEKAKDVAQRFAYEQVQMGRRRQQEVRDKRVADLKKAGKASMAEAEEAFQAANTALFNDANVRLFAQQADLQVEALTATQLADRQDKINAALRKAVDAYTQTSKVAGADKADEALLQMATIYDQRLKDSGAAMATWLEIVRQFSGTSVAEDASWRIAQTYERQQKYAEAVEAYEAFLRNYRRSPNAGQAQFAVAENYEHLGEWVKAMDSYTNYLNNFPEGPLAGKAKDQINWIKTYRL